MKAAEIFDLKGEVALVTGASSGLGRRFAQVLAANGAAVALVARRADRLTELCGTIERSGGRAIAVAADVTDRDAMVRAFDAAEKAFGISTIVVNNAGVAQSQRLVDMPFAEWRRVLDTNLDAVFAWGQEGARRMLEANKHGCIINIASVLGFGASKGVGAYAVSKAAVVQLTKVMALEWAFKGVRVNAIAPGWFPTELTKDFLESEQGLALMRNIPMGRFGQDGDLDGPLLLLASKAGSFMTGATLIADGGQVIALH